MVEFGGNNILYYRTVGDYRRLRELANKAQRFAVLGGGFIGSEIAAALRMNHKEVIMLHEDNANTMGHWAGRNMAATPQRYEHLPFFYSDLFELGYEAVGELDARLATVADWKEPFREGVVYYHRDGQIRGVLLWNVWGQVEAARQLISGRRQFQPQDLRQDLLKAGELFPHRTTPALLDLPDAPPSCNDSKRKRRERRTHPGPPASFRRNWRNFA